jgi:hypothetical protein
MPPSFLSSLQRCGAYATQGTAGPLVQHDFWCHLWITVKVSCYCPHDPPLRSAVVRVHHEALHAQREFWRLLLRTNAFVTSIEKAFLEMETTTEHAMKLYHR